MSRDAFHIRAIIWQVRSEMNPLMYGFPCAVAPSCLPERTKTSSRTSPGCVSRRKSRRMCGMVVREPGKSGKKKAKRRLFVKTTTKAPGLQSRGFVIPACYATCLTPSLRHRFARRRKCGRRRRHRRTRRLLHLHRRLRQMLQPKLEMRRERRSGGDQGPEDHVLLQADEHVHP